MPTAYTILFCLIIFVAVTTWFIPAGSYDYADGVPVSGSYHTVDPAPQGVGAVLKAAFNGFYNAVDVCVFILMVGGFLGVVMKTGAIDAGVSNLIARLQGRENRLITILMLFFGLGGTTYGMWEETMAFFPLLLPVFLAAGYDAVVGVAVVLLGAGAGVIASTVNPFATGIAAGFAGVTLGDGLLWRVLQFIVFEGIAIWYVSAYAARIKRDPSRSVVGIGAGRLHADVGTVTPLTRRHIAVLIVFAATFLIMVYGVIPFDEMGLPLPVLGAMSVYCALLGESLRLHGMYDTFRIAAIGNAPYIVTVTAGGAAKRVGLSGGFSNSARANDPYSRWQSVLLPVFLAAAVVFGVLSTLETKQNALLAWNLSVMLASANLLAFPMVCALPLKRIAARLAKSGSAVAGFSGADAIRRSNCVILTDGDLFPPGTVTLGGLKVFGEESGKVISYAATMAHASESGLSRLFDNLLASDGGFREQVEDVDFYEEGGVGGRIHGETVLFGTAGFMRKRGVNLPRNLGLKTGVFLSVDGTLIAVFAVKYMPAENVDWALHALHHSRITPVLAVRDGNITPALLKRKFGTDARAVYPKLSTRLALSERAGGRPYALLMREGLMPYAEVVLGSKRLCASAKRCTVLAFLAATASTLLAFYLTFVGAYSVLTPLSLLIYVLLWSLSALVDALLSDRY